MNSGLQCCREEFGSAASRGSISSVVWRLSDGSCWGWILFGQYWGQFWEIAAQSIALPSFPLYSIPSFLNRWGSVQVCREFSWGP